MIYFTSDHHFSHNNIIKYCNRPFQTIEEMNEFMIQKWNETIQPGDVVYYLGDFSLSINPVETILSKLNGIKTLIVGNHDFCHPAHPKSKTMEKHDYWIGQYKQRGFTEVLQASYITIGEKIALMTHMPYLNQDSEDDRYPKYRPINNDLWLIHGHVHDRWKIKDKMINVGVDVWDYVPVSIEQIEQIMK